MPNRRLKVVKIKEILRLHYEARLGQRPIARSLKLSKTSIRNTISRFKECGLKWSDVKEFSEGKLLESLYPPNEVKSPAGKPIPDYKHIFKEIVRPNVTLQLLWEEYRQQHPDGLGRSQFYDGYKAFKGTQGLTMKIIHKGGDKLFVDYSGNGLEYVNMETGEVEPVQIFIASWGASSKCYCEATETQKSEEWVNSHVRMFEYFGCVSAALVPDNLKSGVIKPSWYEPEFNPLYRKMAEHYGTVILPARVRHPQDKAVVESNVLHLQRYILGRLRNRTFFSLAEINHALYELLEEFNNRPMKEYGGQSRNERFEELDKPYAKPLAAERYSVSKIKIDLRVGPNYHIEFDRHHYSVPFQLVKEKVDVHQSGNLLEIYHKGEHVCRHQKRPPNFGYTTIDSHMPPNHRFIKGINPSWLVFKGGEIGPNTAQVIKTVLERRKHPEQGYKSSLGILRLADKFSREKLELSSRRALYFNSISYKSLKAILENGLEGQPLNIDSVSENQFEPAQHDNIRGEQYYAGI